jgi:hypothetical protein
MNFKLYHVFELLIGFDNVDAVDNRSGKQFNGYVCDVVPVLLQSEGKSHHLLKLGL